MREDSKSLVVNHLLGCLRGVPCKEVKLYVVESHVLVMGVALEVHECLMEMMESRKRGLIEKWVKRC